MSYQLNNSAPPFRVAYGCWLHAAKMQDNCETGFVFHYNGVQAKQLLQFVNTLLAEMENLAVVDWAKRPSAQSRVKVYLKRLLAIAGVEGLTIDKWQPLLKWLIREIEGRD